MSEEPRKHVRINDIFLGPIERPALQYFCKIAPCLDDPRYDDPDRHHSAR